MKKKLSILSAIVLLASAAGVATASPPASFTPGINVQGVNPIVVTPSVSGSIPVSPSTTLSFQAAAPVVITPAAPPTVVNPSVSVQATIQLK